MVKGVGKIICAGSKKPAGNDYLCAPFKGYGFVA